MITYITAFIFYTLAMVGILLIGFVVYKKTMMGAKSDNKGVIKVIDSLAIGPKKTLLVVKIRNEKFLIASGAEHTTFLAKLADNDVVKNPSCEVPVQARKPVQKDNEYASVPLFQTKEVSYDELKKIKSKRGLGKLGSSNK